MGVGEVDRGGRRWNARRGRRRPTRQFAQALAQQLVDAGTEVAISARLQIDHGQSHAIQYLLDGIDVPVVPLVVNVFAAPLPTMPRVAELGANIARAIAEIGDDSGSSSSPRAGCPTSCRGPATGPIPRATTRSSSSRPGSTVAVSGSATTSVAARSSSPRSRRSSRTSTRQFLADLEKGELRQYARADLRADRRACRQRRPGAAHVVADDRRSRLRPGQDPGLLADAGVADRHGRRRDRARRRSEAGRTHDDHRHHRARATSPAAGPPPESRFATADGVTYHYYDARLRPRHDLPARRWPRLHRVERLRAGGTVLRRRPALCARRHPAVRAVREVSDHRVPCGTSTRPRRWR